MDLKTLADEALTSLGIRTTVSTKIERNPVLMDEKSYYYSFLEKSVEMNAKQKGWSQNDAALIEWFLSETDLPAEQFQLKQAIKIVEPHKFYSWLRTDIEQGPKGSRAKWGALQNDLKHLKQHLESMRYTPNKV